MEANRITLNPSAITRILGAITLFLLLASFTGQVAKFWTGHGRIYGLVPLFDVDVEQNIPTLFSVCLLLFAASLLAVIRAFESRQRTADTSRWTTLSIGFLYMAVDEAASIHEKVGHLIHGVVGEGPLGLFHFASVVPGIAIVIAVGLFFLGFLMRLPPGTRFAFMAAGAIFIGGAVGFEMIGGSYARFHGEANLTYSMITTVEEGLEMTGVVVFINALLKYIADHYGEVQFRVERVEKEPVTDGASRVPRPATAPEYGAVRHEMPQEGGEARVAGAP